MEGKIIRRDFKRRQKLFGVGKNVKEGIKGSVRKWSKIISVGEMGR